MQNSLKKDKLPFQLEKEIITDLKTKILGKAAEFSELERIYSVFSILSELENKTCAVYIPPFYDFRGRFYYRSRLTPQGDKLIRNVIYYGSYSQEELIQKDKTIERLLDEKPLLFLKDAATSLLEKNLPLLANLNTSSCTLVQAALMCIYDVGRIDKKSLGKQAHFNQFISLGLNTLEQYSKLLTRNQDESNRLSSVTLNLFFDDKKE